MNSVYLTAVKKFSRAKYPVYGTKSLFSFYPYSFFLRNSNTSSFTYTIGANCVWYLYYYYYILHRL